MKMFANVVLAALSSVLLSACGGGGSSGPYVDVTLSVENLSVDEGGTQTLTIAATPGASVVIEGGKVVSIRKGEGKYIVSAGQVDRTITERFYISARLDGAIAPYRELKVVVNNVSGAPTENAVTSTLASTNSILALEEDFALYRAVIESMYLEDALGDAGATATFPPMSYSEKEAMIAGFSPENGAYYDLLQQSLTDLEIAFDQYSLGMISEVTLQDTLVNAQNVIKQHAQYGAEQLNPLFQALYPDVDLEAQTKLEYSSEAGRYSRFIGDTDFGSYDGNSWTFSDNFALLDAIVPTQDNNIGFCEA